MTSNPYQGNLDLIKDFFKKPLILVFVIASFFSWAFDSVVEALGAKSLVSLEAFKWGRDLIIEAQDKADFKFADISSAEPSSSSFSMDVVGILIPLAFLLFYIFSKSSDRTKTLTAPSILFEISAIFSIVAASVVLVTVVLVIVLLAIFAPAYLWLAPIAAAASAFLFLYALGQKKFSKSIKKSMNSIYLLNKGAMFFGVMCFVSAVIELAMCSGEAFLFTKYPEDVFSFVMLSVNSAVKIAQAVLLGIIAVVFSNYISRVSTDLVLEGASEPQPETNQPLTCKKCGKPLGEDDYFCNNCGTTVEK